METEQCQNIAQIPDGYLWCSNCDLLTPHEECDPCPYQVCKVCGEKNWLDGCPNCGWMDERITDTPAELEIIAHHPGCHFHENWHFEYTNLVGQPFDDNYTNSTVFDFFQDNDFPHHNPRVILEIRSKMCDDCKCPRYIVFDHLNTWGHWHHQNRDGEWESGMNVRCPKCGETFNYEY